MSKPMTILGVLVTLGLLTAALASGHLFSPLFVLAVLAAAWAWQAEAHGAHWQWAEPSPAEPASSQPHSSGGAGRGGQWMPEA